MVRPIRRIRQGGLDMTVDLKRVAMNWRRHGPCNCGSDKEVFEAMDSRGITLTLGCETCLPGKLSGYRKDVLYGPSYETEERIEPEDY